MSNTKSYHQYDGTAKSLEAVSKGRFSSYITVITDAAWIRSSFGRVQIKKGQYVVETNKGLDLSDTGPKKQPEPVDPADDVQPVSTEVKPVVTKAAAKKPAAPKKTVATKKSAVAKKKNDGTKKG